MDFKKYKDISFNKLLKVVPSRYKNLLYASKHPEISDVIIFPANEVLLSSRIRKAVRSFSENENNNKLILGYSFTYDAKTMMQENNIAYVELFDFGWTDESYLHIRKIVKSYR